MSAVSLLHPFRRKECDAVHRCSHWILVRILHFSSHFGLRCIWIFVISSLPILDVWCCCCCCSCSCSGPAEFRISAKNEPAEREPKQSRLRTKIIRNSFPLETSHWWHIFRIFLRLLENIIQSPNGRNSSALYSGIDTIGESCTRPYVRAVFAAFDTKEFHARNTIDKS